jgi:hypothetical protein
MADCAREENNGGQVVADEHGRQLVCIRCGSPLAHGRCRVCVVSAESWFVHRELVVLTTLTVIVVAGFLLTRAAARANHELRLGDARLWFAAGEREWPPVVRRRRFGRCAVLPQSTITTGRTVWHSARY